VPIYIYATVLFIFSNTLWLGVGKIVINYSYNELYQIAVGVSIITYFHQNRDYYNLARITKWVLIFLFITAIMTIVSSIIDPLYARNITQLSTFGEKEQEIVLAFKRLGGGTYSTATVFMCMFPILVYYIKNPNIFSSSKVIIIFGVILFLALLGMQIVANVVIAGVFLVIAILGVKKIKYSIITVGILFMLLSIVPKQKYADISFYGANKLSNYKEISFKLNDIAEFIQNDGILDKKSRNATTARAIRYPKLLEVLKENPFWGVYSSFDIQKTSYNFGFAHLFWMNKLVTTGILLSLSYLYILFFFFRKTLFKFSLEYKFYFIIAATAILSYGFFKVIAGRETWYTFFIILPGMYYLPLLKKEKKKDSDKKIKALISSYRTKTSPG
jgi:hypothetical protein